MPIFKAKYVVLTHDWPELHWDLMLEIEASLRTFRLSQPPDHTGPISATPLKDHRRVYLDYEGPVSRGRGSVVRWDRGEYKLLEESQQRLEVQFSGGRLNGQGVFQLRADPAEWEFSFQSD